MFICVSECKSVFICVCNVCDSGLSICVSVYKVVYVGGFVCQCMWVRDFFVFCNYIYVSMNIGMTDRLSLTLYVGVCVYMCIRRYVILFMYPSICLTGCLYVTVCITLTTDYLSVWQYNCMCMTVVLSISVCFWLSLSLSKCLCMFLVLSLCVWLVVSP